MKVIIPSNVSFCTSNFICDVAKSDRANFYHTLNGNFLKFFVLIAKSTILKYEIKIFSPMFKNIKNKAICW